MEPPTRVDPPADTRKRIRGSTRTPLGRAEMTNGSTQHVPVLAQEVLTALGPLAGRTIVDGTLGGGGHARLLAEAVGREGRLLALDRDPGAVERAAARLAELGVDCIHANYADLPEVLAELGIPAVDGIVLDLGLSSDQLADSQRGFSFHSSGPLDLRFDTTQGEPAWKLLGRLSDEHLANLLFELGEERYSRRIARQIVSAAPRVARANGQPVGRTGPPCGTAGSPRADRSRHAVVSGVADRGERRA